MMIIAAVFIAVLIIPLAITLGAGGVLLHVSFQVMGSRLQGSSGRSLTRFWGFQKIPMTCARAPGIAQFLVHVRRLGSKSRVQGLAV